ncbi:MAG: hypothetical protein Tsb0013_16010 [Phycisphaerales bacterium]
MSLRTAQHRLADASRSLDQKWTDLRAVWRDEAARSFEKDTISRVDPAVRHALSAMARMAEMLQRARSECE